MKTVKACTTRGKSGGFKSTRAIKVTGGNPQAPEYWVQKLLGGGTITTSGVDVDNDKALTYSAFWCAVNIIAGAVGYLPLKTYEKITPRGRRVVDEHAVYGLLHDAPNEWMHALTFKETLTSHALSWGNGYAEIERNEGGGAVALWPLLPHRTRPKITADFQKIYEIDSPEGSKRYLPDANVLHIHGLGFDGLKGYNVIDYAHQGVGLGLATEKYGATFFGNNSNPGGVLESARLLSDKAYERMKKTWNDLHHGLDNAHRMAILEEGMTWKSIGVPPEHAQFLESRKFQVSEIARWFQIPPHYLGDLDRATFNNIEHQGLEFVMYTLARWLKRWEMECNRKLFSTAQRRIYYTEFLVDALLRGATLDRYNAYHQAINDGWMSRNEIRDRENMNPAAGLDEYLRPQNMAVAGVDVETDPAKMMTDMNAEPEMEPAVTKRKKTTRKAK